MIVTESVNKKELTSNSQSSRYLLAVRMYKCYQSNLQMQSDYNDCIISITSYSTLPYDPALLVLVLHSIILAFQWTDILGGQTLDCLNALLAACRGTRHMAYSQQSPNVLVDYKR